ncbi:MAG: hypothetical protein ACSW8F_00050 [bacterium]
MAKDQEYTDFTGEDTVGDYPADDTTYTLESILSEYKGSAYIRGERKTAPSELDQKVQDILREAGRQQDSTTVFHPVEPPAEKPAPKPARDPDVTPVPAPQVLFEDETDEDNGKYFESREFQDAVSHQLEEQDDWSESDMELPYDEPVEEPAEEEPEDERPGLFARLFRRKKAEAEEPEAPGEPEIEDEDENDAFVPVATEPEEPEDLHAELDRFRLPLQALRLRSWGVGLIGVLMLVLTHLYTAGKELPFGIGASAVAAVGAILILQLLSMLLGLDVLIGGVEELLRCAAGNDTLVLVSCVFTVLDGISILYHGSFTNGLPFSLLSVTSLFFSLRARVQYHRAMLDSLRVYESAKTPSGIVFQRFTQREEERSTLKKAPGLTEGFYGRLMCRDAGESAYQIAAPLLLLVAFLFALLSSVGQGRSADFGHAMALMTAVCAAFPAATVFTMPFRYAATGLKASGAALAGWGGACEIDDAEGCLVTDEDLFPPGSVSLSGVRFFEGFNNRDCLQLCSSLIISARCGISGIFAELLRSQGIGSRAATELTTYEGGGIGGKVGGKEILVGSGAFMHLMGIRVPEKANTVNALFAAINGELAVIYTVNYLPQNYVAAALKMLLNTKTGIFLALRDFNLTPNIIRQKFKVSMDGVETLPAELSYELTTEEPERGTRVTAILSRDGLSSLADVIAKGRFLKMVTGLNALISLGGTALGLLLMFFLASSGAFVSASAENAFIFMAAIELCVVLLSQLVRRRP